MTTARTLGIVLRGVIFGTLLFLALIHLVIVNDALRVFRYQGF